MGIVSRRAGWLQAIWLGLTLLAAPAQAAAPAARLLEAPLVSPATALGGYDLAGERTLGAVGGPLTSPEIEAQARSLGAGRVSAAEYTQNVFTYVRGNIAVEFRFGLGKGARGALIEQSGTPFDQAELMARLLQAGGVASELQLGVITLTAEQFGRWTGVANVSETTQTVEVGKGAACRLLADGGIPATIQGVGDCAAASGALAEVSLLHVWVAVGGQRYDPAFKAHRIRQGLDIAATLQCGVRAAPTCSNALVPAALTGATVQEAQGASPAYVQGVNEQALATTLQGYARTLQNVIVATDRLARLEDVAGGKSIDPSYAPAPGVLPYTASVTYTWSANGPGGGTAVPNAFRTLVRLRAGAVDQTFFADELSGRRVRMTHGDGVYVDNQLLTTLPCGSCVADAVLLTIDHPYYANGGHYGDEDVLFRLVEFQDGFTKGSYPLTLVLGVGVAAASLEAHVAGLQEAAPLDDGRTDCGGSADGRNYFATCRNDEQPLHAAKLLVQGGAADRLNGGVHNATLTRHHDIGVVYGQPGAPSSASYMSVHSAISSVSHTSDAGLRKRAFEVSAAMWAMLEGSVVQQARDAQRSFSPSALFSVENSTWGRKFYNITSAAELDVFLEALCPGAACPSAQRLQAEFNAPRPAGEPYSIIAPEGGLAEVFAGVGRVAYVIKEAIKGGGVTQYDPTRSPLESVRSVEAGKGRQAPWAISTADGALTISPPADIVTGVEAFPTSLALERSYWGNSGLIEQYLSSYGASTSDSDPDNSSESTSTTWTYAGPDHSWQPHIGGGWTHNFNVTATYSNNGLRAMGSERGLEAAAALAGVFALGDLLAEPTFNRRLIAVFATNWLSDRLLYNSVSINRGGQTEVFHRLPDGSFNAAGASQARLDQSGERTSSLSYEPITLTYTGGDGDRINFTWAYRAVGPGPNGLPARMGPYFKADTWTFPTGVVVRFDYDLRQLKLSGNTGSVVLNPQLPSAQILRRVSNSLGRSLTFTTEPLGHSLTAFPPVPGYPTTLPATYRITRVTDENGRYAQYAVSGCPLNHFFACDVLTVTYPDGKHASYQYAADAASPDPATPFKWNYRLRRIYDDQVQGAPAPIATVRYDEWFRVLSVVDGLNRVESYHPASLFGQELWKQGDLIDRAGGRWSKVFDEKNNVLAATDPLGRRTSNQYDQAGRLIRTQSPEGNATETAYDQRGNVVRTCLIPKERAGQPCAAPPGGEDIVTTTAYAGGPALSSADCASMAAICNKPVSETDPRGFTTDYQWDAATGLLLQVLRPADVSNVRPQVDFSYSTFTGADGAAFKLLREKIEKRTATESLVTRYAYDPAAKFTLKTATVDPDGLAITTCFGFDPAGNLARTTDPRAESCP